MDKWTGQVDIPETNRQIDGAKAHREEIERYQQTDGQKDKQMDIQIVGYTYEQINGQTD